MAEEDRWGASANGRAAGGQDQSAEEGRRSSLTSLFLNLVVPLDEKENGPGYFGRR